MDRLHQYCRCVDGLILSQPGSGLKQFKSRTELFIGPRDHELMGQLYAIRSDIEHLNEHKYLEVSDRAKRLELVQKEVIAEQIARNALAHIIANLADLPDGLRRSFWDGPREEGIGTFGKALPKWPNTQCRLFSLTDRVIL
jgi:hypothetical protein